MLTQRERERQRGPKPDKTVERANPDGGRRETRNQAGRERNWRRKRLKKRWGKTGSQKNEASQPERARRPGEGRRQNQIRQESDNKGLILMAVASGLWGSQLQGAGIPKLSKTRLGEIASHLLPVVRGDHSIYSRNGSLPEPGLRARRDREGKEEGVRPAERRQCKRGDSERDRRKRTPRSRETKGTDAQDGAVWPVWARSEKPRHKVAEITHGGPAAAVELGDSLLS